MASKTLVFIHGMFMTPLCWERWIAYGQGQGYECLAPAWPGRDRSVEALRAAHPDPQVGHLTLSAVVDHLADQLRALPEPPALIGHSMGGLIVQLLLQQDGLARAGVAIDSAPPAGVITLKWSFLRANWPMVNPLVSKYRPRQMPLRAFQYAFVNTLPRAEQRAAYERYMVPESRQIPRESTGRAGRIDFRKPHAPLLLIAGMQDHIVPARLNRSNYRRYRASPSATQFKEFAGRDHFIIGEPGWEEVAAYALDWLAQN